MSKRPLRTLAAVAVVLAVATACSGGGSKAASTTVASPARQQGALAAARACRMWTELMSEALPKEPITPAAAQPLDAKSAQVATQANNAATADPAWGDLATDAAGANDFASAALPDINSRIVKDCAKVPADAASTVKGEPDPFGTTTTAP
ncbi:MAG TPA: hypothetical protein VFA83_24300 [Acidimicrobiales bacterium]|nr:hypothetical protein [Acidimicrobiales bacterium]